MRFKHKLFVVFSFCVVILIFFMKYGNFLSLKSIPDKNKLIPQSSVFVGVKTSFKFHSTRLKILTDTWIPTADDSVYIFTDANGNPDSGNQVVTFCAPTHNVGGLCCKYEAMVKQFLELPEKLWFCHVDDDTYVNMDNLVSFLSTIPTNKNLYIGRPSLDHPLNVVPSTSPFWFATGGAGICMTRQLVEKMKYDLTWGHFIRHCQTTSLPDDCTVAYLMSKFANVSLTVENRFHSHLETLKLLNPTALKEAITLSYSLTSNRKNIVSLPNYVSLRPNDDTHIYSIHCWLFPDSRICR